jgi:hypothetical protein
MLIAIFSLQALAQFSAFEIVAPDTQDRLNDEIKSLSVEKMEDGRFIVKVPKFRSKHVWLITCSSELGYGQSEFRDNIWNRDSHDSNIYVLAKPGDSPVPCTVDDRRAESGFVEVILSNDLMSRSYIYIDYPHGVFDGGYYYSVDLPAYLRQMNASES